MKAQQGGVYKRELWSARDWGMVMVLLSVQLPKKLSVVKLSVVSTLHIYDASSIFNA